MNRSLRATFLGMGINVVLAASKFAAGILGHSHALIADAVDSLADIFASMIVWRAVIVANEPADHGHPYGHGKAEPLAAAIISTMLLLAGIGIAYRSIHQILLPRQAPEAYTLWVLLGVIVIKEALFRFVSREASSVESMVVYADAWHHRCDAITSLSAAIGITVALIGGPGFEIADDVAALVAAGLIAWNGLRLLQPAFNELMDAAPDSALTLRVKKIAGEVPGVRCVEKCIIRKTGYNYFVDMHVEVDGQITVQTGHGIAHQVKDRVRAEIPAVYDVLVHIEPERGK